MKIAGKVIESRAKGERVPAMENYLSVKAASERYGVSQTQIRYLLRQGTVVGQKVIREWLVDRHSLEKYVHNRPKPGPKKA
jgi:hypothetical protein